MDYVTVNENNWPRVREEQGDELSGYQFEEINFTEETLKSLIFIDCKFSKCNLSNASLQNSVLRSVVFENCNLMGINWIDLRKGGDFGFHSCKLDYGCFQGLDLRGKNFVDCSIKEADFSQANLSKACFSGSNLAGTSFSNVNIEKSDFRNCLNYFIDPRFAKMKEAKFSFPEAIVLLQALGIEVEM